MADDPTTDAGGIDLTAALGATEPASTQMLTLYVPDKDREDRKIQNQERWVDEAGDLLVRIGGGVTIFPPTRGRWKRPDGKVLSEKTVILYTYVRAAEFRACMGDLREFLHRLGR